jgi:alpha-glucosidase
MKHKLHSLRRSLAQSVFFALLAPLAGFAGLLQADDSTNTTGDTAAADPAAVVICGHARFTVLTPQLLRLEWSQDGRFEDRASLAFINRRLPVPKFEVLRESSVTTIRTDALTLRYDSGRGSEGRFCADNLEITFQLNGNRPTWRPGIPNTGNLQGTTRTLDGARGDKTRDPIEQGLVSRDGWALVDDSTRPLFDSADFSFSQGMRSTWPWVQPRPPGARQDWYFFGYGHEYRQALGDFTRVAGKIPLPPRFAFGAWWSRYWPYSDQELLELVQGFRENDLPLDVFVIDMEWHKTFPERGLEKDANGQRLGWTGYSWNRDLFPEPERFMRRLHDEGLKLTLNLHPASGVRPWEDRYPEMARAMGIDPATKAIIPFTITDKKFATNYLEILHHPLEGQGIDFWWLDWQQGSKTALSGLNPIWWLNYVHFTDQQRQGKRPLLFHRWGGLGNHRYQIGFSGDTVSVWESLAFQPWFTATAANVGYAYWSHDIGGHMPGKVDPELYLRWIQFGIFSPIFRTHTTKNADSERRVWAYPEPYSGLMKQAYRLRYALGPYLYTEARRTYDLGVAFMRPLYYDWPESEEAYTSRDEYLFGDQLIVSPVTAPENADTHLAARRIWLPPGEWIEWPTGRHFSGPATLDRSFSMDQIPVYARSGAIVPMQPPVHYTGERPVDPLILTVFPLSQGQTSKYRVYEDDGHAEDYQHGICRWTSISATQAGDECTVRVASAEGKVPALPSERAYEIRLPFDWPPETVIVNGSALARSEAPQGPGWHFEGNTLTTVVRTARQSIGEALEIRIQRTPGLFSRRAALDGFTGRMTRLRAVFETLTKGFPNLYSPSELTAAMQTGNRIGYHPETAPEEINRLPAKCEQALSFVVAHMRKAGLPDEELSKELMKNTTKAIPPDEAQEQLLRYRRSLALAFAQLQDATPLNSSEHRASCGAECGGKECAGGR